MTSEELEREYQRQANLANTIGLSVPVALQLQTVILLKQILEVVLRPPIIVNENEIKVNPARAAAPATPKAPKA